MYVKRLYRQYRPEEKTAPPGEKRPLCTSSSNQGAMGDVCQEATSPVPPGGENSTILGTIGGMSQQQNLTSNLGGLSAKSHNVSRIEKTWKMKVEVGKISRGVKISDIG